MTTTFDRLNELFSYEEFEVAPEAASRWRSIGDDVINELAVNQSNIESYLKAENGWLPKSFDDVIKFLDGTREMIAIADKMMSRLNEAGMVPDEILGHYALNLIQRSFYLYGAMTVYLESNGVPIPDHNPMLLVVPAGLAE